MPKSNSSVSTPRGSEVEKNPCRLVVLVVDAVVVPVVLIEPEVRHAHRGRGDIVERNDVIVGRLDGRSFMKVGGQEHPKIPAFRLDGGLVVLDHAGQLGIRPEGTLIDRASRRRGGRRGGETGVTALVVPVGAAEIKGVLFETSGVERTARADPIMISATIAAPNIARAERAMRPRRCDPLHKSFQKRSVLGPGFHVSGSGPIGDLIGHTFKSSYTSSVRISGFKPVPNCHFSIFAETKASRSTPLGGPTHAGPDGRRSRRKGSARDRRGQRPGGRGENGLSMGPEHVPSSA